jgi:putative transposase
MKKYETYSHAKTKLRYHLIFSTKYRRKFLNDIRDSVLSAFNYAESISQFKILIMEVDKDHIHILITFKPNISISQVVRRLKQITTIYLWENNEQFLKKFYWKNKKILWTGGYFASTIGEVSEETLKHYIENQG